MKESMKRRFVRGALAALVLVAFFRCDQRSEAATINNGIFIDGKDVSGLNSSQATDMIENEIDTAAQATIELVSPTGYSVSVHPSDLDMTWSNRDIVKYAVNYGDKGNIVQRYKIKKDLEYGKLYLNTEIDYNRDKIIKLINDHEDVFDQEAIDYELSRENGEFIIKTGQAGIIVDPSASADEIIRFLKENWDGSDVTLDLVSVVDEPLGSAGELSQINDVIGSFTTEYKSSGSSRCTNIANGCKLINGSTVYPGEQFSVLEHLVPFTAQNGYQLAGSYQNGLVVDTLGGGICQVSSTLYNAVLLAELQVDQRQNHSMIVDYVSPSGDAAIAESSNKDFKFTNNRDFPIYIEGYTTDSKTITFNIYGLENRPANREISFKSEVLERTVPDHENIIQDPAQPLGYYSVTSSHAGIKARYIKEVKVDGVLQSSEEINTSTYKMVPRTIVVGVSTENGEAYAQMQEAIATGSVDQVKATAKYWAAQNAAAAQEAAATVGDP